MNSGSVILHRSYPMEHHTVHDECQLLRYGNSSATEKEHPMCISLTCTIHSIGQRVDVRIVYVLGDNTSFERVQCPRTTDVIGVGFVVIDSRCC